MFFGKTEEIIFRELSNRVGYNTRICVFYNTCRWVTDYHPSLFKIKWSITDKKSVGDYFNEMIYKYSNFNNLLDFYNSLDISKIYIFDLCPPPEERIMPCERYILYWYTVFFKLCW